MKGFRSEVSNENFKLKFVFAAHITGDETPLLSLQGQSRGSNALSCRVRIRLRIGLTWMLALYVKVPWKLFASK